MDPSFLNFRMDKRRIVDLEGSEALAPSFRRLSLEVLPASEWM